MRAWRRAIAGDVVLHEATNEHLVLHRLLQPQPGFGTRRGRANHPHERVRWGVAQHVLPLRRVSRTPPPFRNSQQGARRRSIFLNAGGLGCALGTSGCGHLDRLHSPASPAGECKVKTKRASYQEDGLPVASLLKRSVRRNTSTHTAMDRKGSREDNLASASGNSSPPCPSPACLCTRDVKDKYTRVHLLSAFLRAKDPIDKRERSEFPQ